MRTEAPLSGTPWNSLRVSQSWDMANLGVPPTSRINTLNFLAFLIADAAKSRSTPRLQTASVTWLCSAPIPLYWLVYRHSNQISVVIESGASLIHARMRASLDELDEGEFTEGHGKSVARVPTLGQVDDLMLVDTEDHLLLTRQLDDEFQLLAGWMHQLDSHIALDLGNFCAAAQEFEAQHVERSR